MNKRLSHKISRLFAGAPLVFLLSPAAISAAPSDGLSSLRELNKNQYERCFTSDPGSDDEKHACSEWLASSACNGTYVDNRGEISEFVAKENLITYLKEASSIAAKSKKCDAMGQKQLQLSLIYRDSHSTAAATLERWKAIFSGFDKLLPEQQRFLCDAVAERQELQVLLADKKQRPVLARCLNSLDASSSRSRATAFAFESAAPDLVNDDTRALLALDDIKAQRYQTARERILAIDTGRLSENNRRELLDKVATYSKILFPDGRLEDALPWRAGFEPPQTEPENRMMRLLSQAFESAGDQMPWLCELEASRLIPQGRQREVALRTGDLLSRRPTDRATADYVRRLTALAVSTGNTALLRELVMALASHGDAARSMLAGQPVTQLIDSLSRDFHARTALETGTKKNADGAQDDLKAFQALLALADDARRPKALLALGYAQHRAGAPREALKSWLSAASASDPSTSPESWFLAIHTMNSLGMKKEAAEQAKQFHERYPASKWAAGFAPQD